jgi:hypothetical protein
MALLQTTCPWRQVHLARTGEVYQLYERFGSFDSSAVIARPMTVNSFVTLLNEERKKAACRKSSKRRRDR